MSQMLVEKWSKAPGQLSIADIKDQYVKDNISVLLQNQQTKNIEQELFVENAFATGTGTVSVAGNPAGNIPAGGAGNGVFAPISMALVRRTFPALFANKVVGVQAMSTPIGLAYAIRYFYRENPQEPGLTSGYKEVGWDNVPEYSGFTGSNANHSNPDWADTAATTSAEKMFGEAAEGWNDAEEWNLGRPWDKNPADTDVKTYPQISFQIDRQPIVAKARKLGASFSLESAMDVKAMHDIEVERELINMIQYEIVAEQDREILGRMIQASQRTGRAQTSDSDKPNLWVEWGGAKATEFDLAQSDGRWSQEKYATIITAIVDKANEIAMKTRRGAGNFVVVSPRVASALQAAGPQFCRNTSFVDATTVFPEIGSINETIKVYRDQYAQSDYALVGYKGPGISDAGIIYSPYVTGLTSRAVDPQDFSPRVGVMSRYAITDTLLGSGRYYRLIKFNNLDKLIYGQASSVTPTTKSEGGWNN